LVVDDDETVQPLLSSFVEKQGHEAVCASACEEALERMDTKRSLVLVDMLLPNMFGIKVLQRMKEIDPSVTVHAVTGVAKHAKGIESLKKGASGFGTKPLELEHLVSLIDFHLLRTATTG
jgi:DNA-binding NtrC family response regulator